MRFQLLNKSFNGYQTATEGWGFDANSLEEAEQYLDKLINATSTVQEDNLVNLEEIFNGPIDFYSAKGFNQDFDSFTNLTTGEDLSEWYKDKFGG